MSMTATVVALALIGSGGEPRGQAQITYEVRFVEVQGLGWRGDHHGVLTMVAQRGGASVWTAPSTLADSLAARGCRLVSSPKIRANPGSPVTCSNGTRKAYVRDVVRVADGPVREARAVAYKPEIATIEEGLWLQMDGRPIDQGVLAHMEIREVRVPSIASYYVTEAPGHPHEGETPLPSIQARVQVPEVVEGTVEGEWLIPNSGLLVVSLGVRPVSASEGTPEVGEMLALISARLDPTPEATSPSTEPMPIGPSVLFAPEPVRHQPAAFHPAGATPIAGGSAPTPVAPGHLASSALPPLPSRSLPTPRDALGREMPLPPLPTEELAEVEDSGEARPSPQMPRPKVPTEVDGVLPDELATPGPRDLIARAGVSTGTDAISAREQSTATGEVRRRFTLRFELEAIFSDQEGRPVVPATPSDRTHGPDSDPSDSGSPPDRFKGQRFSEARDICPGCASSAACPVSEADEPGPLSIRQEVAGIADLRTHLLATSLFGLGAGAVPSPMVVAVEELKVDPSIRAVSHGEGEEPRFRLRVRLGGVARPAKVSIAPLFIRIPVGPSCLLELEELADLEVGILPSR